MDLGYALAVGALLVGIGIFFFAFSGIEGREVDVPEPVAQTEQPGVSLEELPIVTPQQKDATGAWVVHIRDNYFDPTRIVITQGESVTWINDGEKLHSVVTLRGMKILDSGKLASGGRWTYTFDVDPKEYEYFDPLQQSMFGSIIVNPA